MNKHKLIRLILFLHLAAYVLLTAIYTVDETEVAVLTRFGAPLERVRKPGLRLKFPWPIDRVIRVDQRVLFLHSESQEMLTDDEKNVIIEGYVLWKIHDPIRFVETAKTRENAEIRLRDLYTSRMGAKIGNLPFDSFVNVGLDKLNFRDIYDQVMQQINVTARPFFGITVEGIQITGFTLPTANRASVIARMNAERARIAARYRSEGVEVALKIEAKAAAEHEDIMSVAHATATEILGKAEADSMRILADAYRKDPKFYEFLRSLESYESIISDKTTLFLETNSKLFKTLYGDGAIK